MNRIPDAAEATIHDLAFALLDACRAQVGLLPDAHRATAGQLLSGTISMAVQSVVMANSQTMAAKGEDFASLEPDMAGAIYRGLGAGVGQCIGAAGDEISLTGLMDAYMDGMMRTIEARSAMSRADFLKSSLSKGRKP